MFRALQLSHVGWAFRALHDDEVAAELAGVNVSRYRIYAATIGSAMIGLTGALIAYSAGFISPATYSFDRVDVRVLVMVAFGGLGTLLGPVIGASVFAILDERLTASLELREVLYGVFVIAIFLFSGEASCTHSSRCTAVSAARAAPSQRSRRLASSASSHPGYGRRASREPRELADHEGDARAPRATAQRGLQAARAGSRAPSGRGARRVADPLRSPS